MSAAAPFDTCEAGISSDHSRRRSLVRKEQSEVRMRSFEYEGELDKRDNVDMYAFQIKSSVTRSWEEGLREVWVDKQLTG
jgi:hypothetical protein